MFLLNSHSIKLSKKDINKNFIIKNKINIDTNMKH